MNIDKLKPAWMQYKLENSMDKLDRDTILGIIEAPEPMVYPLSKFTMLNACVMVFMMICCQGG